MSLPRVPPYKESILIPGESRSVKLLGGIENKYPVRQMTGTLCNLADPKVTLNEIMAISEYSLLPCKQYTLAYQQNNTFSLNIANIHIQHSIEQITLIHFGAQITSKVSNWSIISTLSISHLVSNQSISQLKRYPVHQ